MLDEPVPPALSRVGIGDAGGNWAACAQAARHVRLPARGGGWRA